MLKKAVFLSVSVFLLISCYPLATFQGPDVLPVDKEVIGLGMNWMTNMVAVVDSSTGNEDSFLGESSIMFRRGFPKRIEVGLKFVGTPWRRGAMMADIKWQVISKPVLIALDFAVSSWPYSAEHKYSGYHPSLIIGSEKLFMGAQYNYLRSSEWVQETQDFFIGRHYDIKESDSRFSPIIGVHFKLGDTSNIYYSLGFNFSMTFAELLKR
jgi:hypothetical protein